MRMCEKGGNTLTRCRAIEFATSTTSPCHHRLACQSHCTTASDTSWVRYGSERVALLLNAPRSPDTGTLRGLLLVLLPQIPGKEEHSGLQSGPVLAPTKGFTAAVQLQRDPQARGWPGQRFVGGEAPTRRSPSGETRGIYVMSDDELLERGRTVLEGPDLPR